MAALHESLLASRRQARQRLRVIDAIERQHRATSLVDLAALAVSGALQQLRTAGSDAVGSEDVSW